MIRFLFRFIGLLCLALAFIFLVYDGTRTIADHTLYIFKVSDVWASVHQSSLDQVKPTLERLSPWLYTVVDTYLLSSMRSIGWPGPIRIPTSRRS